VIEQYKWWSVDIMSFSDCEFVVKGLQRSASDDAIGIIHGRTCVETKHKSETMMVSVEGGEVIIMSLFNRRDFFVNSTARQ